jgi:hypothetical protein
VKISIEKEQFSKIFSSDPYDKEKIAKIGKFCTKHAIKTKKAPPKIEFGNFSIFEYCSFGLGVGIN